LFEGHSTSAGRKRAGGWRGKGKSGGGRWLLLETFLDLKIFVYIICWQCRRLCWYLVNCARFSFYTKGDNLAGRDGNCVLHSTSAQGEELLTNGWIQAPASGSMLVSGHLHYYLERGKAQFAPSRCAPKSLCPRRDLLGTLQSSYNPNSAKFL
jgi:hypothetical protein